MVHEMIKGADAVAYSAGARAPTLPAQAICLRARQAEYRSRADRPDDPGVGLSYSDGPECSSFHD